MVRLEEAVSLAALGLSLHSGLYLPFGFQPPATERERAQGQQRCAQGPELGPVWPQQQERSKCAAHWVQHLCRGLLSP